METKICTKCGRELPLDQFNWRDKAKGTRRADCKQCHSGYMKAQYQEKKETIQDIKAELKCQKCGYDKCAEALDFHHINPEEKEDRIARMISNNYSLDKIKEEMKKCIVLCSNCHREFHHYEKTKGITLEQFLKQSRILIGRESGFDPE